MGFYMAYYCGTFVVPLIIHQIISPANGQCNIHITQGCDNRDPLTNIADEIQQLKDELFHRLDKQNESIYEHNASFEEMRSQLDTLLMSSKAVDRFSSGRDICREHFRSVHEVFNESFQEMKSQYDTFMTSLQELRVDLFDQLSKQVQSINELNTSFQDMKIHLVTFNTSFQTVDRCPLERDICREQFQGMHEVFNESFQEMKSQHGAILTSLQAVDRRLEEHDISIRNQTRNSQTFANGKCDPASEMCDCSDIKASGQNRPTSGVYEVCVGQQRNRTCTSAYCDMEAANRASVVFQRRKDGSVNFNRTWGEYREGFGNPDGEYWLGNEMLYLLTSKRKYKLRVDLEDFNGAKRYAEYANFSISSSSDNYRLTIGNYSGNAGDSLDYHSGNQFSTIDADNDGSGENGALTYGGGGWWYRSGGDFYANLNAIYRQRYETFSSWMGIHWYHWHAAGSVSLKSTEMKLVPVA